MWNNGTINCYGFINEETLNNGSQITVNSLARIYMPIVLRDFKGGSVTYGIYKEESDKHMVPYNQMEFRNISSKLRVNYDGVINLWANIYAGDQQNFTTVSGINTSGTLINLTDSNNSYLISKHNPNTEVSDIKTIIRIGYGYSNFERLRNRIMYIKN